MEQTVATQPLLGQWGALLFGVGLPLGIVLAVGLVAGLVYWMRRPRVYAATPAVATPAPAGAPLRRRMGGSTAFIAVLSLIVILVLGYVFTDVIFEYVGTAELVETGGPLSVWDVFQVLTAFAVISILGGVVYAYLKGTGSSPTRVAFVCFSILTLAFAVFTWDSVVKLAHETGLTVESNGAAANSTSSRTPPEKVVVKIFPGESYGPIETTPRCLSAWSNGTTPLGANSLSETPQAIRSNEFERNKFVWFRAPELPPPGIEYYTVTYFFTYPGEAGWYGGKDCPASRQDS